MSFLVVENVDEWDHFILGRNFIKKFDATLDLNNEMFRIRNPEMKYILKPVLEGKGETDKENNRRSTTVVETARDN